MATTVNIKQVTFDKALVDFRRFAPTAATVRKYDRQGLTSRVRLGDVHSDGDYLYSTDGHRALRVDARYISEIPEDGPFNYGLHDGKQRESNYPEMGRLFPRECNLNATIRCDKLKELREAVKQVAQDVRARNVTNNEVYIEFEAGNITIKAGGEGLDDFGHAVTVVEATRDQTSFSFRVNYRYLADALLTASKLRRLRGYDLYVRFTSDLRPIILTDGGVYEIILMPIRRR